MLRERADFRRVRCWAAGARRDYSEDMREYDGGGDPGFDDDHDPIRDFVGPSGIPADARRLGFDRNTEEGAMIAMAASLDPAKWSHRLVAWLLLVSFVLPLLLGMVREIV